MRDLKLDLLFNLGRHPVKLPKNKPIHNSASGRASRANPQSEIYNPKFRVPVVQRRERGFSNPKASPSHGKILFREAARTRQNQPMADNYLVITGNTR